LPFRSCTLVGKFALGALALASAASGQIATPPERPVQRIPFARLYELSPLAVPTNAGLGTVETVQRVPPPDTLTFATIQSYLHSDNAYETEGNRQSSDGWNGYFVASWVPYSTREWTPRLTLQESVYRFFDEPGANYESQSAVLSSRLALNSAQTWNWFAAASYWRYAGTLGGGGKFYEYVGLDSGLMYATAIGGRDDLMLVGTFLMRGRLSDPGYLTRIEPWLGLTLLYNPTPTVTLSPYVRPALFWYSNDSEFGENRRDFNLSAGFTATWTPIEYFSVSASYGWTGNYSSADFRSYTESLPMVSLFGTFSF